MPSELSIVIPVYNEAENFPELWRALTANVRSPFCAHVIYDFDQDTTVPIVQQTIKNGETRLQLMSNRYGRGVVGAIRTGFDLIENGPVLVVMADLSDDLARIDSMLELYRQGFGLVAGSRYMQGGAIVNGPWLKQALSRLGSVSLYWLRGLPIHDATNAFKIYDAEMLRSFTIESRGGFELNLELTVKAFLAGYRMTEVPAVWRERTKGKSRFRLWKWLPAYLRWWLYAFRPRTSTMRTIAGSTK